MAAADGPATRAERQERTRQALVVAAREVFARDGYHGARLDVIAAAAGFSKGAIYSNFAGKAELFLAVLDLNIGAVRDDGSVPHGDGELTAEERAGLEAQVSGFALATLEFIAAAARDDALRGALAQRVGAVVEHYYGPRAEREGSADDALPVAERAALLAALDQGAALLTLSGIATVDQRLLELGIRRLLGTAGVADAPVDVPGGGAPALHPTDVQQRLADSMRD